MKKILKLFVSMTMMLALTACSQDSTSSVKVEDGDAVVIDFVGKIDDVAFDGGTASGQLLQIGAGRYIPGFEEGIVGIGLGETKDVSVTFPESYTSGLAGQDAVFTITVNKIFRAVDKGEVADGDVVLMDFVGTIDGVAFDGGTASGQLAQIGAGRYIPGFEEGIVGIALGETKDVPVTFPENYGTASLAGQDAVFAITVQSLFKEITK